MSIQKYVSYENNTGLEHNGTTRLYQLPRKQYYLKSL